MTQGHNNPPAVVLELTVEEAEFLMRNCDSNMAQGLQILSSPDLISEDTLRKIVDLIEAFRPICDKLKKGLS